MCIFSGICIDCKYELDPDTDEDLIKNHTQLKSELKNLLFTQERIFTGRPSWGLSPRTADIEYSCEELYEKTKPYFHPFDVDYLELLNQIGNSRIDRGKSLKIEESGGPLLMGCIDFMLYNLRSDAKKRTVNKKSTY